MENTPQASDISFDPSVSTLYQSTPSSENANTPKLYKLSRKRKASFLEMSHEICNVRKLSEIMESSPTPQFSSTFNESLMNNLEKIHINNEDKNCINSTKFEIDDTPVISSKILNKNNVNKMYRSAPNTPEKQIKLSRDIPKKANTNSFIKHLSLMNVQSHSPLNKDAYDILYPSLPSLERQRLPGTPQKYDKSVTPVKKCLFFKSHKNLFDSIIYNGIIMNKILKYLSNGDLFRLAQVSKSLKKSIMSDWQASLRYRCYIQVHDNQKENYKITPPSSPEKDSGYEDASPASKNYVYFMEIASSLTKNQSITKCPRCNKPAVVENSVGQCQEINHCGYIFCLKCNSFANNPKDFKDECKNAQLSIFKPRNLLSDVSNSTFTSDYVTDSASSFFSSSLNLNSSRYDSSGIFSGCENSTPKLSVKRNLSKSLINSEVKVLSANNITKSREYISKSQHRASFVPVLPLRSKKIDEIIEPSSPPKVKQYSACSKQSKRNLKRLTR